MKIFEKVGLTKPKMSGFDKSHERKMTFNMGELIPCYFDEIVPGDQFKVSTEMMIRLSPMISPIMHRVNAYVHYFFVPNRIVWDEWEDFITGGSDGTASPTFPMTSWGVWSGARNAVGSLGDYLGLPATDGTVQTAQVNVSMLPFRAYQKIFNDYYRDQTLQSEIDLTNSTDCLDLRTRCWGKDYFTSALPWTQRGTAPTIPVQGTGSATYSSISQVKDSTGSPMGAENLSSSSAGNLTGATSGDGRIENISSISMTNVDIDVNELRRTSAIQRWLEKQARGGGRYIETILSHFGVASKDKRLQRAEYLGGGRQPVVISEVLNTSATATESQGNMSGHGISVGNINSFKQRFTEHGYVFGILSVLPKTSYQQGIHRLWTRDDKSEFYWPDYAHLGEQAVTIGGGRQPVVISEVLNTSATATESQGNMSGHGISVGNINSFKQRFTEHGYVFGILSVLPKTSYQQGIHRLWTRDDKSEFYWPDYAHLGEQAINNSELYYDGTDAVYNAATFGYQQRYAEMKYQCDSVHGEMRDDYDEWHMGRIFSSQPSLNETFVKSNPTDRIFAVTAGNPDQLICQVYNKVQALRPMPYFANPKIV